MVTEQLVIVPSQSCNSKLFQSSNDRRALQVYSQARLQVADIRGEPPSDAHIVLEQVQALLRNVSTRITSPGDNLPLARALLMHRRVDILVYEAKGQLESRAAGAARESYRQVGGVARWLRGEEVGVCIVCFFCCAFGSKVAIL